MFFFNQPHSFNRVRFYQKEYNFTLNFCELVFEKFNSKIRNETERNERLCKVFLSETLEILFFDHF